MTSVSFQRWIADSYRNLEESIAKNPTEFQAEKVQCIVDMLMATGTPIPESTCDSLKSRNIQFSQETPSVLSYLVQSHLVEKSAPIQEILLHQKELSNVSISSRLIQELEQLDNTMDRLVLLSTVAKAPPPLTFTKAKQYFLFLSIIIKAAIHWSNRASAEQVQDLYSALSSCKKSTFQRTLCSVLKIRITLSPELRNANKNLAEEPPLASDTDPDEDGFFDALEGPDDLFEILVNFDEDKAIEELKLPIPTTAMPITSSSLLIENSSLSQNSAESLSNVIQGSLGLLDIEESSLKSSENNHTITFPNATTHKVSTKDADSFSVLSDGYKTILKGILAPILWFKTMVIEAPQEISFVISNQDNGAIVEFKDPATTFSLKNFPYFSGTYALSSLRYEISSEGLISITPGLKKVTNGAWEEQEVFGDALQGENAHLLTYGKDLWAILKQDMS